MGQSVLIIAGFIQIGIGVAWWLNTHQIENTYEQKIELVRALNGDILHQGFGERFFKEYKIVEKE